MKNSYNFLWLSLALFPLLALSFMLSIPAQDYWWYLRLGKDILTQGAIPLVDTMGYSRAGLPIFYQQWLSGIIFYLVYETGGVAFTYILRGILIATSYGMIWWMARGRSGPRVATILIILLGLSTSNNWVMRPQLFAYPLFLISLLAIYEWHQGRNQRLFLLPVALLLWVNLHGSFVLPFLLTGAALIFGNGNRKSMLITILVMLIFSLINPYGFGVWQYLAFILNNPSDYLFSVEWRAPSNEGWQLNIFFAWLLLFIPLAGISKQKLSLLEWIWFLGFGWLALSGIRYVIWFMFFLTIFSAKLLSEWTNLYIDKPIEKINPRINYLLSVLLILLSFIFLPSIRDSWWKSAPPHYELSTTPIEAVEFLKTREDLPGPLWNDYAFGSYLEFELPARPTWIDTRMYSFPQAQWEEYVRVTNADGWQEMFDRESINLLLLSKAAQPKLIDAVSKSNLWCEEYSDDYAVIFSRCETKQ
jgi:hypothetical protein